MREILIAKSAGFCFGVNRAVEKAMEASGQPGPVVTLGEIIHNPAVVEELEQQGVHSIETLSEAPDGALVIIRAHGVPESCYRELKERNLKCLDLTCPFVQKIQKIVSEQPPEKVVLIAGNPDHPEVKGIAGHCRGQYFVFSNAGELEKYLLSREDISETAFILVTQTTFRVSEWKKSAETAEKLCTNLEIFDTICRATVIRQEEALQLSQKADVMIVVGGRHSSNTLKLYQICSSNCPTVLVERAEELEPHGRLFRAARIIGITAGASTPASIIKEVQLTMSNANISEDMTFEEMLQESFKSTYNGEKVTGIVTGIKPNEISVDIGSKYAGYVPLKELTDDPNAQTSDIVKVGDEIELLVVRTNDVEGTAMLSKKRLDAAVGFEKVMNAAETGETLTGVVTEVIKGGILVLSNGVKVFVPGTLSGVPRRNGDLNSLLKKEVQFKVLETNRQRRRAVGSISAVLKEERDKLAEAFWAEVEPGKVYTGTVKDITNYGVFVNLGAVDGRIGLSDLTWLRVKHPSEVVSVGDTVEVTVKDVDTENKKVSLIYKKTEDNPWEKIKTMYQVGDVVDVKVMSVTAFGAFAQIIPGIDGLIHISQIAKERVEKVADKLKVGDEVKAKITELDYERKRASLSIKQLILDEEAAAAEAEAAAEEEAPAEEAAPVEE